ncbi:helix-turn-helix domain-containing protein [Kineosporia rhizophila]|uniref:helix-turn-helix domain-containing protein n=1 Tax=Kineosporia rhizophila TaxID=84633 RepID=UPI001E35C0E3|nr:helix-turn-helix domain-containing protein [Kineosporia rhizophila]
MRRRRLGATLRRLRNGANLSLDEAAARMGWKAPKMSKIENATLGIRAPDVKRLLDVYEVEDETVLPALENLARDAGKRGWWQTYSGVMSQSYADYIALESDASRIRQWSGLIPGLLQTGAYAREVITATNDAGITADEVNGLVEVRQARQAVLTRPGAPLELWAVINQAALHQRFAMRPETMRDQLRRLREVAELPGITIQVMPLACTPHPGLAGPFSVVSFPGPMLDVVLLENFLGNSYLEDEKAGPAFGSAFERIVAAALAPDDSLALIHRLEDESS